MTAPNLTIKVEPAEASEDERGIDGECRPDDDESPYANDATSVNE
jgi:hypothetical protein